MRGRTALPATVTGRRGALRLAVVLLCATAWAGEPAPSGARPARPDPGAFRLAFEDRTDDFVLLQYELPALARFAYVVASQGHAVVVDPPLGFDQVLEGLPAKDFRVEAVVLTGTHGTFLEDHGEIAARTGAAVLGASRHEGEARSRALADEEKIPLGQATLTWWETPGALPDGSSLLVRRFATSSAPEYVLTGDLLTSGSLGECADPLGVTPATTLAEQAFESLRRLEVLGDETYVLPSLDTRKPGVPKASVSTLADERANNPWLSIRDRATFVARALADRTPTVDDARLLALANRDDGGPGRPLPPVPAVAAGTIAPALCDHVWLVDPRPSDAYATAHVRGAIHLAAGGPFERWWMRVVPRGAPVYVLADEARARALQTRLARVGRSTLAGRLEGDPAAWRVAGLEVLRSVRVTPRDLALRRAAGLGPFVVDVRTPRERARGWIADSLHLPVSRLAGGLDALPHTTTLLFVCASGYRSSIAVGLAERAGRERIEDLVGGMHAWEKAGLPLQRIVSTSAK